MRSHFARRLLAALLVSLPLAPAPRAASAQLAQQQRIGLVELYGLRTLDPERIRRLPELGGPDLAPAQRRRLEERIRALPGVRDVDVSAVCCEEGRSVLFVGVAEEGAPAIAFRDPPTGRVPIPDEVRRAGMAFDSAFRAAIEAGDFVEDSEAGHALMHYPAARRAQERFVPLAARHGAQLRRVLRESSDPGARALAAQVLAYAADKRTVVGDLVLAMRDPSPSVRNDAVRALALIAGLAQQKPALGIRVPYEPFVDLLGSVVWTDRNKASLALMGLTASRDAALLARLRQRALPQLVEMARWKSSGHALPPFWVVGRIAGLSDEKIWDAWTRGERERVIAAAERARK